MTTCIWCKAIDAPPSVEHIIPEALGCPPDFELTGGVVCMACNNGLGHIDSALVDEFDFVLFGANIPRKGGRTPEVRSRGNVIARRGTDGPEIHFNMEPHPVAGPRGETLSPYKGKPRNIKAQFEVVGMVAKVGFEVPFGQGPKFIRGLHKIALSSLVYFLGPELALESKFDAVRRYVRHGEGKRQVLFRPADDKGYAHHVNAPYTSGSGNYLVGMRIGIVEFLVDLSPTMSVLPVLHQKSLEIPPTYHWLPPTPSNAS
jgi:hypothetical protein